MFSFIKKSYQSITTSEKKFLFWAILVIIFLSSIIPIYAKLIETDQFYYTGIDARAGSDKTVYFSQIEQARQGKILFKNLYSSEPQQGSFFAPIWLVLGWLGKLTTLSNFAVFHLARIFFGALFLFLLYLFSAQVFKKISYRKISFILLGFSSGLGIFSLKRFISVEIMYEHFGTDLWVSEGNTFLTITHSPLFILSQIFILLIFWWTIERFKKCSYREALAMGFFTLFLGIFHPYDLVTIFGVLSVWLIIEFIREKRWRWPLVFKLGIIGLVSSLAIVYFLWIFAAESALGGWAAQNITLSPKFLNYAIGYGVLFITTLVALYKLCKSQNIYFRFLGIWIIVDWYLLFIPVQFQRRLANGLHIPMAMAGLIGIILIINWFKFFPPKLFKSLVFQSIVITIITLGLFLTSLFNIFLGLVVLSAKSPPQFITRNTYEAMLWLKDNIDENQVVLTEPTMGNILPSVTGGLVYIGHGHQTIDWSTKFAKSKLWFFIKNNQDVIKKEWLHQEKIDYIFFSALENGLGDYFPGEKEYLDKVYDNGEVKIFKVK